MKSLTLKLRNHLLSDIGHWNVCRQDLVATCDVNPSSVQVIATVLMLQEEVRGGAM